MKPNSAKSDPIWIWDILGSSSTDLWPAFVKSGTNAGQILALAQILVEVCQVFPEGWQKHNTESNLGFCRTQAKLGHCWQDVVVVGLNLNSKRSFEATMDLSKFAGGKYQDMVRAA